MGFRLALVDFDGTLADSMPYWLALPRDTLREYGIPEPEGFEELIRALPMWEVGLHLGKEYPELVRDMPLRERWDAKMLENYRQRIPRKAGSRELLRLLRAEGCTVAVLSATRQPHLDLALEHLELMPLLDEVFTEAEAGSKHEPETYLHLAEKFGCAVSEVLLVEDAPRNLRTAHDLGVGTAAVRDESMAHWQEEIRSFAGVYLPTLEDLAPLRAYLEKGEDRT